MCDSRHKLHYVSFALWLALTLLDPALLPVAQQNNSPAPDDSAQPARAEIIRLPVSVTDGRRNPLTGLSKQDFTVSVDGKPQDIALFEGGDEPSSVCILFDTSGSMAGTRTTDSWRRKILEAANLIPSRFAAMSHPSNEYFLVTFSKHPKVLLDGVGRDEFISELDRLPPTSIQGKTALYDALRLGLEKLSGAAHRRQAILLISDDGPDSASQTKGKELKLLAGLRGVPIYFISVWGEDWDSPGTDGVSAEELVKLTGGTYYVPVPYDSFRTDTVKLLGEITEFAARGIRYQYTLGFTPAAPDDKWHKVKVKVTSPPGGPKLKGVVVRSPEKYYAAGDLGAPVRRVRGDTQ